MFKTTSNQRYQNIVTVCLSVSQITSVEPLVSYGGASTLTQHLHQSLRWFFGIAAVVTDLGHVLLVDLCLDDLSCSQSELEASGEDNIIFFLSVCFYTSLFTDSFHLLV